MNDCKQELEGSEILLFEDPKLKLIYLFRININLKQIRHIYVFHHQIGDVFLVIKIHGFILNNVLML
jgi:hypothetical protein